MTTGDEEADRLVDDLFREVDDQFADLEREYHQAREEMATDNDRRDTTLDALGASNERFELMSQVATLQAEVSRQRDELDERDRLLTELGDKIAGFEADIAKRDEMLTELRTAKQEALDERREQSRLAALLDARAAERQELGELTQRLKNERDHVQELLTTALARFDEAEAAMAQMDDKVRHLEAARDTAAHEHDSRAHELIESRAEMSKLTDQLAELARSTAVADQRAEKANALAERRTNEAGYLNRRIDAMTDKLQASGTFEEDSKNLRRELTLNERRITELERDVDTAQAEAAAANTAVDAIANRTADYDELVQQVVRLEEERDAAWEAASGYTPAPARPVEAETSTGPEDVASLADRARELGARRSSEAELAAHAVEEAAEAAEDSYEDAAVDDVDGARGEAATGDVHGVSDEAPAFGGHGVDARLESFDGEPAGESVDGELASSDDSASDGPLPTSVGAAFHAGATIEPTTTRSSDLEGLDHDDGAESSTAVEPGDDTTADVAVHAGAAIESATTGSSDLEDLDDADVDLIDSDLDRLAASVETPEADLEFHGAESLPRIDLDSLSSDTGVDIPAIEAPDSASDTFLTDTAEIPAVSDSAAADGPAATVVDLAAGESDHTQAADANEAHATEAAPGASQEPEVIPLITLEHLADADVPLIVAPESAAKRKRTILPADLEPNTPEAVAHLLNQPGVTAIIDARSTCGRTGMRPSELFERIVLLRDHFDVPIEVVVTPVSTPVGGAPDLPAIGVHHVTGADTVADRIRALCMGLPADQPLVVIAGDDHVRRAAIGEEANVVEPSAVLNLADD